jgi:hypothetical protein
MRRARQASAAQLLAGKGLLLAGVVPRDLVADISLAADNERWEGLDAGTQADFDEALEAYVAVCADARCHKRYTQSWQQHAAAPFAEALMELVATYRSYRPLIDAISAADFMPAADPNALDTNDQHGVSDMVAAPAAEAAPDAALKPSDEGDIARSRLDGDGCETSSWNEGIAGAQAAADVMTYAAHVTAVATILGDEKDYGVEKGRSWTAGEAEALAALAPSACVSAALEHAEQHEAAVGMAESTEEAASTTAAVGVAQAASTSISPAGDTSTQEDAEAAAPVVLPRTGAQLAVHKIGSSTPGTATPKTTPLQAVALHPSAASRPAAAPPLATAEVPLASAVASSLAPAVLQPPSLLSHMERVCSSSAVPRASLSARESVAPPLGDALADGERLKSSSSFGRRKDSKMAKISRSLSWNTRRKQKTEAAVEASGCGGGSGGDAGEPAPGAVSASAEVRVSVPCDELGLLAQDGAAVAAVEQTPRAIEIDSADIIDGSTQAARVQTRTWSFSRRARGKKPAQVMLLST